MNDANAETLSTLYYVSHYFHVVGLQETHFMGTRRSDRTRQLKRLSHSLNPFCDIKITYTSLLSCVGGCADNAYILNS